jgi:hypothetical protein
LLDPDRVQIFSGPRYYFSGQDIIFQDIIFPRLFSGGAPATTQFCDGWTLGRTETVIQIFERQHP